jgi:hypothetical protein
VVTPESNALASSVTTLTGEELQELVNPVACHPEPGVAIDRVQENRFVILVVLDQGLFEKVDIL